jgi:predicted house-cleaning noncanonical NTP pyrophosphatase (MazG superfamily)
MRQEHNKLVRDLIPEIIRQAGRQCDSIILSESEYRQALRDKLLEEAQEAATANREDLIEELADLLDVIDALIESHHISQESIVLTRDQKRAEKGGFTQKVKLLWTE